MFAVTSIAYSVSVCIFDMPSNHNNVFIKHIDHTACSVIISTVAVEGRLTLGRSTYKLHHCVNPNEPSYLIVTLHLELLQSVI